MSSQEAEKVSKILSAAQSGDVDLFWAAAMQLSGEEVHEITEERGRTALHYAAQARAKSHDKEWAMLAG